jgi:hypothetical protein
VPIAQKSCHHFISTPVSVVYLFIIGIPAMQLFNLRG